MIDRITSLEKQVKTLQGQVTSLQSQVTAMNRELVKVDERTEAKYNTLKECPAWAKPTIGKLIDEGYLKGDGGGLALTEDLTRTLVIVDRAGGFDK